MKALKILKKDKSRVVIKADKENCCYGPTGYDAKIEVLLYDRDI